MPATRHRRTFVRDDGETEVEVSFEFTPGTPESGVSGPPEHYDPGSGPEFSDVEAVLLSDRATRIALTEAEIDRFETETVEDPDFDPLPTRYED